MEIKISVDAPKGWTRRVLLYVATPLALVGVTAAIASAGPMNPIDTSWIAAPHQISAALLKANLDDLQTQCTANQTQATSQQAQITSLQTQVATLQSPIVARSRTMGNVQVIPSGTSTFLEMGTTDFDPKSAVTALPWAFKCPVSGYYHIDLNIGWTLSTWPASSHEVDIYVGGVEYVRLSIVTEPGGAPNYTSNTGSSLVLCNAGQNIQLKASQNSGQSISTDGTSSVSVSLASL
jgi:hypothetical protein